MTVRSWNSETTVTSWFYDSLYTLRHLTDHHTSVAVRIGEGVANRYINSGISPKSPTTANWNTPCYTADGCSSKSSSEHLWVQKTVISSESYTLAHPHFVVSVWYFASGRVPKISWWVIVNWNGFLWAFQLTVIRYSMRCQWKSRPIRGVEVSSLIWRLVTSLVEKVIVKIDLSSKLSHLSTIGYPQETPFNVKNRFGFLTTNI